MCGRFSLRVSARGRRGEGQDNAPRTETLHPRKPRLRLARAMCGRSGVCVPRVRFSLLESLDGCHWVWVIAAGCAGAARLPAVPREAAARRASPATCFPPGETSSEGDSSRGSLSLCCLVFIPCKFFPASPVLPGVHGREHSSSDSDRDGSALWHPSSMLAHSLSWDRQLPWLLVFRTSRAVGRLLMIGRAD